MNWFRSRIRSGAPGRSPNFEIGEPSKIPARFRLNVTGALARLTFVMAASAALWATKAQAHPHVWATIKTDLLYATDGSVTGVRHAWTFDDMFSAFATIGIKAKTKGQFTREELQPLAKINVDSLKGFAYFTYALIDGVPAKNAFNDAVDYWLGYDPKATVLTLHFTLPFKKPVKAKLLKIQVYDPEFFIDFAFAKKNPVTLVGAPPLCAVWTEKPDDPHFLSSQNLNRSFVASEAFVGMGAEFANNILVQCP